MRGDCRPVEGQQRPPAFAFSGEEVSRLYSFLDGIHEYQDTFRDVVWAGLMVVRLKGYLPGMRLTPIVLPPVLATVLAAGLHGLVSAGVVLDTLLCAGLLIGSLALSGYLRPVLAFGDELRQHRP